VHTVADEHVPQLEEQAEHVDPFKKYPLLHVAHVLDVLPATAQFSAEETEHVFVPSL